MKNIESLKELALTHGFTVKEDMLYRNRVSVEMLNNFETYAYVNLENANIYNIHFQMPKGINYNGFGVQDLGEVDMSQVKRLSANMEYFYLFLRKVADLVRYENDLEKKVKISTEINLHIY